MKIIDVFQKIANGEEIDFKIECSGEKYSLSKGCTLLDERNEEVRWYIDEKWLNEEVEIIEEPKKIEKLEPIYKIEQDMKLDSVIAWQKVNNKIFENKINEVIDYINDKENK